MSNTYRRSLGLIELVSLGVGGTIGSGIFVVPGIAAGILGPSSLLAWVIVGLSATCVMLSLTWLSGEFGHTASFSTMFSQVFGERIAAGIIVLYLLGGIFGIGTIAAGVGQYLTFFGIDRVLVAEVIILAFFCSLNLAGIALSGMSENILTLLKVLPLVVIAILLLPFIRIEYLTPIIPFSAAGLLSTILIVYWPFTGFEISAIPVNEVKDPGLIPRSLVIVMVIVSGIYLLLNISLIGSVGSAVLSASPTPVATAVAMVFSRSGAIVAVIGIIAMLSALNAYIIGGSRVLHSAAKSQKLPVLSNLNFRGTPTVPLLLLCFLSAGILFFSNNFERLAVLSVLATLVPYLFFCIGAFLVSSNLSRRLISVIGMVSSIAILVLTFLS
jgi:amino acid transporter